MPSYDSESSDEDGGDYNETNVLLGYASVEPTGDAISHLGGTPTWIDDRARPSGTFAKCKVCNGLLSLLLELHGDLPDHFPGHERRLYIWTCRRPTCRRKDGSVRGIRGVRVAKGASNKPVQLHQKKQPQQQQQQPPPPAMGASLFGVQNGVQNGRPAAANPFSSTPGHPNPFNTSPSPASAEAEDGVSSGLSGLPDTFASRLRLSSPLPTPHPRSQSHEAWPADSSFPTPFPRYHLEAEYESLEAPSVPRMAEDARIDMLADAGEAGRGGKEDKEVFESWIDRTFQKFADRVSENAEQVLRYEFQGKPLLYSDKDSVGKILAPHLEKSTCVVSTKVVSTGSQGGGGTGTGTGTGAGIGFPRCQACGADRVFELQLTPHAIVELEAHDMSVDDGMEWGTIIMAVCGRDCNPDHVSEGEVGYAEEWIGVQWEESVGPK